MSTQLTLSARLVTLLMSAFVLSIGLGGVAEDRPSTPGAIPSAMVLTR